jgi:hypothetical protein
MGRGRVTIGNFVYGKAFHRNGGGGPIQIMPETSTFIHGKNISFGGQLQNPSFTIVSLLFLLNHRLNLTIKIGGC